MALDLRSAQLSLQLLEALDKRSYCHVVDAMARPDRSVQASQFPILDHYNLLDDSRQSLHPTVVQAMQSIW